MSKQTVNALGWAKKAKELTEKNGFFRIKQTNHFQSYAVLAIAADRAGYTQKLTRSRTRWIADDPTIVTAETLVKRVSEYYYERNTRLRGAKPKTNGALPPKTGSLRQQVVALTQKVDQLEQMVNALVDEVG